MVLELFKFREVPNEQGSRFQADSLSNFLKNLPLPSTLELSI